MNKSELIQHIASTAGISKTQAIASLHTFETAVFKVSKALKDALN